MSKINNDAKKAPPIKNKTPKKGTPQTVLCLPTLGTGVGFGLAMLIAFLTFSSRAASNNSSVDAGNFSDCRQRNMTEFSPLVQENCEVALRAGGIALIVTVFISVVISSCFLFRDEILFPPNPQKKRVEKKIPPAQKVPADSVGSLNAANGSDSKSKQYGSAKNQLMAAVTQRGSNYGSTSDSETDNANHYREMSP